MSREIDIALLKGFVIAHKAPMVIMDALFRVENCKVSSVDRGILIDELIDRIPYSKQSIVKTRLKNVMRADGIKTVADILDKSRSDLLLMPLMGRKCLGAFLAELEKIGVTLPN